MFFQSSDVRDEDAACGTGLFQTHRLTHCEKEGN